MTTPINFSYDAAGESTAVLRISGDLAGGISYFAVRDSGPYGSGDQSAVASGAGAAWHSTGPNGPRVSIMVANLEASTQYWAGCYIDDGTASAVVGLTFTTRTLVADGVGGHMAGRLIG